MKMRTSSSPYYIHCCKDKDSQIWSCYQNKDEDINNKRIISGVGAVAEVMVRAVDRIHCLFHLPSNTFEECHSELLIWTHQNLLTHCVFFLCLPVTFLSWFLVEEGSLFVTVRKIGSFVSWDVVLGKGEYHERPTNWFPISLFGNGFPFFPLENHFPKKNQKITIMFVLQELCYIKWGKWSCWVGVKKKSRAGGCEAFEASWFQRNRVW